MNIYQNKKDREELLGPNETYFNNKFIKTHLTIVFLNFYVAHFFLVNLLIEKKSPRQFIFLFTPASKDTLNPNKYSLRLYYKGQLPS